MSLPIRRLRVSLVLIGLVVASCGAPSVTAPPTPDPVRAAADPTISIPLTPQPSAYVAASERPAATPSVDAAVSDPPAATPSASPSPLPGPYLGTTDGCKPGFWARPRNHSLWEEHQPDQLVGAFFPEPQEFAELRLVDALRPTGSEEDARRVLLREAVAAILNGAHESLAYPYSRYETGVDGRRPVVPTVADLLGTGTTEEIEAFTQDLTAANRLGCPLG